MPSDLRRELNLEGSIDFVSVVWTTLQQVRLTNPNKLCLNLLRRMIFFPSLISQFITVYSDVPINPTKVADGNELGLCHIPFINYAHMCSVYR